MPWQGTISVPYESEVLHRNGGIGTSANVDFDVFDRLVSQDSVIGGNWYHFAEVDENVGELTLDPPAVAAAGGDGGRVDFAGHDILVPQPDSVTASGGGNGGNVIAGAPNDMFIDGSTGAAGSNFTTANGTPGLLVPGNSSELKVHGNVGAMAVENTGAVRSTVPIQVTPQGGEPFGTAVQINGTIRPAPPASQGGQIVLSGSGSVPGVDAPAMIGHAGSQHPGHGQVAPIETGAAVPAAQATEGLTAGLGGGIQIQTRGASIATGFVGRDASQADERGRSRRKTRNAIPAEEARGSDFRDVGPKGEADFAEDPLAGERNAPPTDRERYGELIDNEFLSPLTGPLSTFSIDVDTASYTNLRRMITDGSPIPKDAVRIEEMINYFTYNYPQPDGEHPFGLALEAAECPWPPIISCCASESKASR